MIEAYNELPCGTELLLKRTDIQPEAEHNLKHGEKLPGQGPWWIAQLSPVGHCKYCTCPQRSMPWIKAVGRTVEDALVLAVARWEEWKEMVAAEANR